MSMPKWMAKYACPACGAGYGQCRDGASAGLQCCSDCRHPGSTLPDPWTAGELEEMWAGRDMPNYVAREVVRLRG